ncbi:TPA: hypothetical protein ACH3X1_003547 [Trebouxia sp. C0004]
MEHQHRKQKQTSLLQLWARPPAKQRQTVLVGTASTQPSEQGYMSKNNKENVDPKKDAEEFGYTGNISTHSAAGTVANVNEGRYSEGEMRQVLTFVGKAADKVAELAPFTVTKTQHFKVLLETESAKWIVDKERVP